MPTLVIVILFAGCLTLMIGASAVLVRGLDSVGAWLGFSEGILGLLTAVGADAPEISSAMSALQSGHRTVGLGVVLGSNLFNIAVLLGFSAVVAGPLVVSRVGLALDGGVGLIATLLIVVLLSHVIAPLLSVIIIVVLFALYTIALAIAPSKLVRLHLPAKWSNYLSTAVSAVDRESAEDPRVSDARRGKMGIAIVIPAVIAIVAGSIGVVQTSLVLAARWNISEIIMGTIVLAGLTSVPNAYAAIRLARQRRGAAVVSETMNSNTINIVVGIGVPALIYGVGATSNSTLLDLAWLVVMTGMSLGLLARRGGLTRLGGAGLFALYGLFVLAKFVAPPH